mgnify:CR=1 FL=1|jgi:hypothetical protein
MSEIKSKLVIIDDGMVINILNDPKVSSQIQAVKIAVDNARARVGNARKGGCRPCQAKARNIAVNLMSVKKAIAQLSDADKAKLKNIMNAEQARIVYTNDSGKIIQLTF